MKIVRKTEARKFQNSDKCTAFEYPIGDEGINGAVIIIEGRYPDIGMVANTKCKELAYILEGTGKLFTTNGDTEFNPGDLLFIDAGEGFYWEGSFKMFAPCAPAWNLEQYKELK
jgi:mannose-6-phosphate isomerase-like protein (cupin superfamily)